VGKAKSKATIMVAGADGGMAQLHDRRFVAKDWPIQFDVPKEHADTWLEYLTAECTKRGWSSGSIGQLEARENSGTVTINPATSAQPSMELVWERKRGGPLKVRARVPDGSILSRNDAQAILEQVSEKCRTGATEQYYCRGQLHYHGLPWRGEIWLDDRLRLGPPARQFEKALLGPCVVLIDAMVDCVGRGDLGIAFDHKLGELSAFLSVVTGVAVQLPRVGWVWTFLTGSADCEARSLGYFDPADPGATAPHSMPAKGASRAMPLRRIARPDFSLRGIDGSTNENSLPNDTAQLWGMYGALSPDRRRNFLQAAAKWQEAMTHWGEERTLSFALLVVACEALKPSGREFEKHNVYHVVEALLGKDAANRLQENWFRPQDIRSAHMHRGEFRSSEFVRSMMMSSFQDPTFDTAHRELARITQAAIIEWVRKGGNLTMPPLKQPRRTFRRWVKDHVIAAVLLSVVAAGAAGAVVGWNLRALL
jgi:hypothetical protein